ncbi:MAG: hypothetical protein KGJ34_02310 [Patescibacteria group bacterium]|nr:hypothetical protein [Patescibacteria group bacterium]
MGDTVNTSAPTVPTRTSAEAVLEESRIATDEEVQALVTNMLKLRPRRRQIIEKYLQQGRAKAAESLGLQEKTMGSYISDVCFQLEIPKRRGFKRFDRIGTLRKIFEAHKKMVESGEIQITTLYQSEYTAENIEGFAYGMRRLTRRQKQIVEAFVKFAEVASVAKELRILKKTLEVQLFGVCLDLGIRPIRRSCLHQRRDILKQVLERYEELVSEGVIKVPKRQLPSLSMKSKETSAETTPEGQEWVTLFPQLNAEDQKRVIRRLRNIISNYKK